MSSGVLSASREPVHSSFLSAVIDFNVQWSLISQSATSDPPTFSSVLLAGYVPPFVNSPSACASLPQRGSSSGPTSNGGGNGSRILGQPAAMLAAPTKVAASFIARNTNGDPFSSSFV